MLTNQKILIIIGTIPAYLEIYKKNLIRHSSTSTVLKSSIHTVYYISKYIRMTEELQSFFHAFSSDFKVI